MTDQDYFLAKIEQLETACRMALQELDTTPDPCPTVANRRLVIAHLKKVLDLPREAPMVEYNLDGPNGPVTVMAPESVATGMDRPPLRFIKHPNGSRTLQWHDRSGWADVPELHQHDL